MNEELYFKDAFTEVDGSINLEVNNLKANCITSNNNNFNLDSEGNLIVNSITTKQSNDSNIDFDMIYPIGSIYFSVNGVNPETLFGGVWERFAKGRTLVGVDEAQYEFNVVKKEGGSKDIQQHNHSIPSLSGYTNESGGHNHTYGTKKSGSKAANGTYHGTAFNANDYNTSNDGNHSHTFTTNPNNTNTAGTGNSGNLQPYLTCYIWTRIS